MGFGTTDTNQLLDDYLKQKRGNDAMSNWNPYSTGTESAAHLGGELVAGQGQYDKNAQGFINAWQPFQQGSAARSLSMLANPDWMVQNFRSGAQAAGQSTLQQLLARLRQVGAGVGAVGGAAIDANNRANSEGNQFQAHLASPEGQMSIHEAIAHILGLNGPNLPGLEILSRIQNPPQQQDNTMGELGSLAGGLAALAKI